MEEGATPAQIKEVENQAKAMGLKPHVSIGKEKTFIPLNGKSSQEEAMVLKSANGVENILDIDKTYKLAARRSPNENTIISVKGVKIGGDEVVVMAGPCAIESREQLLKTAQALKASGIKMMRASAYKPRSSPYSFQGLGEEGLKMYREIADSFGLVIETEVMDIRDVELVSQYVDVLRVGSRNMQNFDLLKELGKSKKPVILKRGLAATIDEWILAAEYIMAHGNHEVILCERGIRTYESATRNTLDISAVALAKQMTHLPVIVDPSHAAGRIDLIEPLSVAAVAMGADGLLVEVHHDPENALCDGKQSLTPMQLDALMDKIRPIIKSIGKKVA